MKKISCFMVLLATIIIFCGGCSYQKVDDQIHSIINGPDNSQMIVEVPLPPEDQIEYKGIGESLSAYKKYTVTIDGYDVDDVIEKGNKGLTYTLKGVTVYDSIYDAGVDMYGCMYEGDFLDKNAFILIDIQASYVAPEDGEAEIIAFAHELSGACLESKMTPEQKTVTGLFPELSYFSLRPREDDPKLDNQHDFFGYIIQNGESIDFQVGLLCAQEYIDAKNVFLEVNQAPSIEYKVTGDTTRKLFVLFPEGVE